MSLTAYEQILRTKAQAALAALEKATASGDPVAIASARVPVARVQAELRSTTAASGAGALSDMRAALEKATRTAVP